MILKDSDLTNETFHFSSKITNKKKMSVFIPFMDNSTAELNEQFTVPFQLDVFADTVTTFKV